MRDLKAVEIFRTGRWNNDTYTTEDLEQMVAASASWPTPPLKLSHHDGGPAYGWCENLRVRDDRLLADFAALSDRIYEAIKAREYDALSSEILWDVERNGQKFPRVLRAVALLGADL